MGFPGTHGNPLVPFLRTTTISAIHYEVTLFVWNFMSRRTIIESEIEMITEEVEDDSAIIYDKEKKFEQPLKHGLFIWNDVPCSISPCYREYGDYTCTSIVDVWPDIRKKNRLFRGPTHAALDVRFRLVIDANDMIERSRCFVSTPGFIHFTLSREWIARSIHKMIKDGIDTWAPKLSVKKAIIYFWSRNIAKKMSMGLSRSTFIGESLALMLEYSRVEGKSLYDPDISKTLDLLREKGLTIDGEEVLIEGRRLPLVDLAAMWYGIDMVKADWIVHVTDLGKGDYIQVLMNAAKRAGCIVTDHCQQSKIIYVEFGLVEGDAVERSVDLNDLLDEAKSRCKAKLVGQGTAVVDLEHTAEALGYGAVNMEHLQMPELQLLLQLYDKEGLPQDIYNLVNHHDGAKAVWDRVKLLIQGFEISLQERESKRYDEFDIFTLKRVEPIHMYYMRLAKDLHSTNFDHLYAYLRKHEAHANEVRQMRERYLNPLALVANSYNPSLFVITGYFSRS
ncbi:anticodon-binding aminoacyl-tRNA synthetase, class 1a [Tanacetum coccineum]